MLVNFSLENFKSIKNKVTLSFEANNSDDLEDYYIIPNSQNIRLLKLGLIYGANATGKTTILEGLDFLRDIMTEPLDKKNEEFDFQPFKFDEISRKSNTIFSIDFIQADTHYFYEVELNQTHIVSEKLDYKQKNKKNAFTRTTDADKQTSKIRFGNSLTIKKSQQESLEANTLWNNTVLGGYLKTNFESDILKDIQDWFGNSLKPIITPNVSLMESITAYIDEDIIKKADIVRILQKADFNISDIDIEVEEFPLDDEIIEALEKSSTMPKSRINELKDLKKLKYRDLIFKHNVNEDTYELNYNEESHGTRRYYGMSGLLSLMMKNSIIFPIDELESSLHPDLIKHFILSFVSSTDSSQIIATTHLRELLMEKDIFRSDAIWFTDRDDNACTELYSLADFKSDVIRKDTGSVYNAYKSGKLGATPNMGDYYTELSNDQTTAPQ